jgi:hypothetical protein
MARLFASSPLLVLITVVLGALGVSACSSDSPSAPSRNPSPNAPSPGPAPALPPLAEGRYSLLVTAAGPSMGCEITEVGVPLGGRTPVATGWFEQEVVLRQGPDGWSIAPEPNNGLTTTQALRVTGASWPASPVVTGSLAGRSDQRSYDGPMIDAGERDRPASFVGAVLNPGSLGDVIVMTPSTGAIVMTGTVNGRLTFSSAWTGQVTVCRSAQLLLQRP